ncbi:MAG: hypothetical protein A2340_09780 [Lentisphaerae bacterium RIFOXYB12_FULL_60_10]|nr:MAG: hypothetical protein A2340_09780 [Lentisphaerae bacterium RIFOXYB12_FULL_60_10]
MSTPLWSPANKTASILKWADHLHKEAKNVFAKDGTHAGILFAFSALEGLVSVTPIPGNTGSAQVNAAIRRAIRDHHLYGMILIGEAWTYFTNPDDHIAFQILDGEMKVSDLKDSEKTECLYLKMESLDGDSVVFLDRIIRDGDRARLGAGQRIDGDVLAWFE